MWSICTDAKYNTKTLPRQREDKYRMAWHDSKIIYLAPLVFSSMVFVESEETICCPVIMGGWGGGDWKYGEQIKLRENGRHCPRTYSSFLSACSKSAVLINIPSDISWRVCARARISTCWCIHTCFVCVCVCVSYLTLIIFKSRLFLSLACWYAVNVLLLLCKNLFYLFIYFSWCSKTVTDGLLSAQEMCFFSVLGKWVEY